MRLIGKMCDPSRITFAVFRPEAPLSLSWCYTELEGRGGFVVDDHRTAVAFSAPTDPCPFLGVTPS